MRASPGVTVTVDVIPGHGAVNVVWPGVGPGLKRTYGQPLPGHERRLLAFEWHGRPGLVTARTRAQRLMALTQK